MTLFALYCLAGVFVTVLASTERRNAADMFNRWADKERGDQRAYYQDLARESEAFSAVVFDAILWPLTVIRYFLGKL
jgi:hypothetical protein